MEQPIKHAVVTGAGKGIGAAIAKQLAAAGYRVSLLGRKLAPLQAQQQLIGDQATVIECDITDETNVQSAFAQAVDVFGTVDVLVNNAGAATTAPFIKTSRAQFQFMLEVNFLGPCFCIQQVLPAMLEQNSGRIINIASTSAVKGYEYVAAYSASKHAVVGMTRCLALEIAASEVMINSVCPGYTKTDIVDTAIENIMSRTGRSEQETIAELTKFNPQKRLVLPDEVANTVVYLAEYAPLSITGQSIMVDGGEVM